MKIDICVKHRPFQLLITVQFHRMVSFLGYVFGLLNNDVSGSLESGLPRFHCTVVIRETNHGPSILKSLINCFHHVIDIYEDSISVRLLAIPCPPDMLQKYHQASVAMCSCVTMVSCVAIAVILHVHELNHDYVTSIWIPCIVYHVLGQFHNGCIDV